MKNKAILSAILIFILSLCACGGDAGISLPSGEAAYTALTEDEKLLNLENEKPSFIYIGYENEKGYFSAPLQSEDEISAICDALTAMTIGNKLKDEDVESYPIRYIGFEYDDGLDHAYYFASDNCYCYDSEKDILTYYQLDNSEEFFNLFDSYLTSYNEYFNPAGATITVDSFDELLDVADYLVYDDSECTAAIADYEFDKQSETLKIVFNLKNNSSEKRYFKFTDLVINSVSVDTDTWFVLDSGAAASYAAPLNIAAADVEKLETVLFTLNITNSETNPSYTYETEPIYLDLTL